MRYYLFVLLLLAGCNSEVGRYQMILLADQVHIFRLDTTTGEIQRCIQSPSRKKAVCSGDPEYWK